MTKQEIKILIIGVVFAILAGVFTFYLQMEPKEDKKNTEKAPNLSEITMQTAKPRKKDLVAEMETTEGIIKFKLFPEQAPKAVENMQLLAEKNYYDGIIFHRVMEDFMIQTGDPTGTGRGGKSAWGEAFEDEFSSDLKNIRGAVSMANSGPNTNNSQFFIVQTKETPWLDGVHTVFGQVYEGMDVVDKIATTKTDSGDKPLSEISIKSLKVYTLD